VGFIKELEKAEYIVRKTGFYVILNDLTNFLRYGDLTIISPQGNIIDEVKTTGTAKGSQKKHLDEIIKMLNQKVFTQGNQSALYLTIPGKPTCFLSQIEQIINKSLERNEGVYSERVSPYLWVSSTYLPRLKSYFKKTGNFPKKPTAPFPRTDISAPTNSLMFFDQFSPNIMPYSVFPFSEKIIGEVLTGQIQLKMVISEKELKETFRGKGWELTMPPREAIMAVYDTDDIEKIKEAIWDPAFHSMLRKGAFNYRLPREVLLRIETEFRSAKAVIDESEGLMKATSDRVSRMVTTNFSEESVIWK